jgi:hypothetical protein
MLWLLFAGRYTYALQPLCLKAFTHRIELRLMNVCGTDLDALTHSMLVMLGLTVPGASTGH